MPRFVSHNQFFRRLRNIQAEGFYRASTRVRLWSKILDTPPVITDPVTKSGAVEIHVLTYRRDYLSAMWALKSFYHYSAVSYPLIIHLQGPESSRMNTRLREHFPTSTIVPQRQADLSVEQWLTDHGYTLLLKARRQSPMMMKFIDFVITGQATHLLAIDSDVIFFRRPDELLVATPEPRGSDLFMHDASSSYNISPAQALNELGIDLAPRVNCGLMLFLRDPQRLARGEAYLAHSDVARANGLIEQTLHALYASEQHRVSYLTDSYYLSPNETTTPLAKLVCGHYADSSRRLLTEEGIPHLIRTGFLNELRMGDERRPNSCVVSTQQ